MRRAEAAKALLVGLKRPGSRGGAEEFCRGDMVRNTGECIRLGECELAGRRFCQPKVGEGLE